MLEGFEVECCVVGFSGSFLLLPSINIATLQPSNFSINYCRLQLTLQPFNLPTFQQIIAAFH